MAAEDNPSTRAVDMMTCFLIFIPSFSHWTWCQCCEPDVVGCTAMVRPRAETPWRPAPARGRLHQGSGRLGEDFGIEPGASAKADRHRLGRCFKEMQSTRRGGENGPAAA